MRISRTKRDGFGRRSLHGEKPKAVISVRPICACVCVFQNTSLLTVTAHPVQGINIIKHSSRMTFTAVHLLTDWKRTWYPSKKPFECISIKHVFEIPIPYYTYVYTCRWIEWFENCFYANLVVTVSLVIVKVAKKARVNVNNKQLQTGYIMFVFRFTAAAVN